MINIEDILKAACGRLESIGIRMIPYTRPTATDENMDEFIVIYLSSGVRSKEVGGYDDAYWLTTNVSVEIFARDLAKARNASEANFNRISELTNHVVRLFPWTSEEYGLAFVRPYILLTCTNDGDGFHYAKVQLRVTTLTNN